MADTGTSSLNENISCAGAYAASGLAFLAYSTCVQQGEAWFDDAGLVYTLPAMLFLILGKFIVRWYVPYLLLLLAGFIVLVPDRFKPCWLLWICGKTSRSFLFGFSFGVLLVTGAVYSFLLSLDCLLRNEIGR